MKEKRKVYGIESRELHNDVITSDTYYDYDEAINYFNKLKQEEPSKNIEYNLIVFEEEYNQEIDDWEIIDGSNDVLETFTK